VGRRPPGFAAEKEALTAVLATPVSPELVPPRYDGETAQKTEEIVGPYELHDFFLHMVIRRSCGGGDSTDRRMKPRLFCPQRHHRVHPRCAVHGERGRDHGHEDQ